MLKARHHWFIYPYFKRFSRVKTKRNFKKKEIESDFEDRKLPVFFLLNHISWWDGFWAEYLNQKIFGRKYHVMMDEKQLRKHLFLNKTGTFSVNKNSRSLVETINYTTELLQNSDNFVLMFPQGEIQSQFQNQISFLPGAFKILQKCPHEIHLVFGANFVDFFSDKKAGLYSYVSEARKMPKNTEELNEMYQSFYEQSRNKQIKKRF